MQPRPKHCLRQKVQMWFQQGFEAWAKAEDIDIDGLAYQVEWSRAIAHGHVAINAAMLCAKKLGKAPRVCAEAIVAHLPKVDWVASVDLAGPGFINVTFVDALLHDWLLAALSNGFSQLFKGERKPRIHLEYVSANPTGPLHVGHGRAAAYGSCLASVLRRGGAEVDEVYYLNDAGRQIRLLGLSVALRALSEMGCEVAFPSGCYQGHYIIDIAKDFLQAHPGVLADLDQVEGYSTFLSGDGSEEDAEHRLRWLEEKRADEIEQFSAFACAAISDDIKDDLAHFRVQQTWFSEASLLEGDQAGLVIQALEAKGHLYEEEGALWFRATAFGDEKDRVMRRGDGRLTYFAMDAAYHWHKFQQNYDGVIDVFGADHHGYVARLKGVLQALGCAVEHFECPLVQFAILYRGKERLSMSTRSGEFVTLRDLQKEVGVDAARFFYVQRKMDQHVDFDLSLAASQSNDNPVYYIQYAHARIQSVLSQPLAQETTLPADQSAMATLISDAAKELQRHLIRYPDVLRACIWQREVHGLCHYLRELAAALHAYYGAEPCLVEEEQIRQARLTLLQTVASVLKDGANLLGIVLPDRM